MADFAGSNELDTARENYALQRRNEFFNGLLRGDLAPEYDLFTMAARYGISLPSHYTLCLLQREPGNAAAAAKSGTCLSAILTKYLNSLDGYIAWESPDGIGIIFAQDDKPSGQYKEQEIARVEELLQHLASIYHGFSGGIGIASYMTDGFEQFSCRYRQAKDAITRGRQVWPGQLMYHYLDGGVVQFLSHFAEGEEAAEYVERTLGALIAYDRKNQTDLVRTLETIIHSDNLKHAADGLFFHHKTIILRKQRIEKVLGQSVDSFEAKLSLGLALKLLRMTGRPDKENAADQAWPATQPGTPILRG